MLADCKMLTNIDGLLYWNIPRVLRGKYSIGIFDDTPFQRNRPMIYWIDGNGEK